jgi:hypothetical protein
MHIEYENKNTPSNARTFQDLKAGQWYRGVQTGRLYFYYTSERGKPMLLRADDNQDCTSRFQRGGTFVPVDVTILVHDSAQWPRPYAA